MVILKRKLSKKKLQIHLKKHKCIVQWRGVSVIDLIYWIFLVSLLSNFQSILNNLIRIKLFMQKHKIKNNYK